MRRQGLFGSAGIGVILFLSSAAMAADLREPLADPTAALIEPARTGEAALAAYPVRQSLARARAGQARSLYGLAPSDFDDVSTVELDVARVAGALGLAVDDSDTAFLGRVALHVIDDPRVGSSPIATDPTDPYVSVLEEARRSAPVRIQDVGAEASGVVPRRGLRLDYIRPVTSVLPGELEAVVEPRANVLFGEQVSGVGYGAVVRFGRNLTEPRSKSSRWYAFIGADAQALTWSLGGGGEEHSLRLEDKQLIGDYQAGVAVHVGNGDLAFGVVHREVKWNDVSRDEQFVGVSYAIRR
jgi:hypothetical protein